MVANSLDGRQSEISQVQYRTQGAITKHVVIAREFMGTKLICQKTLFTWII